MDDYSGVFAGLSIGAALTAIVAAGVIMAAPGFARWLTEKVATFFDAEDAEEDCQLCDLCGTPYSIAFDLDCECGKCDDNGSA